MTPRSAGSVSADLPFVCRIEDADASQPGLFGGKGAGLARMTAAGLPVPPGGVIATEACRGYGGSLRRSRQRRETESGGAMTDGFDLREGQ